MNISTVAAALVLFASPAFAQSVLTNSAVAPGCGAEGDKFDVTIYQMGWRLGGKAASGRDSEGRIVEHGLHVWFGCYENAFELVRGAYAAWDPQKDQAITEVKDAFEAHAWTGTGTGLPEVDGGR